MRLELSIRDDANPAASRKHELPLNNGPVVIGRGPESPVQFDGTRVSRQHLGFSFSGGSLSVMDLSSTGVWVNEQPVPKNTPVPVAPSDEIRIPGYRIFAIAKVTDELASTVVAKTGAKGAAPVAAKTAAPAGPAWWRLDGKERWALVLIGTAAALLYYYRWL